MPRANTIIVIRPYWYSNTWVFDDPATGLEQEPFVAGVPEMIDRLVQNIPNAGSPDGMAFHAGTPNFLVSNNNDGSITRYDFPNGDLTQAPVQSVFASGGFRGDLTQVGSDGCLYATQYGTLFADGTVNTDGSIVQICPGFIPPVGSSTAVGLGYWKNHKGATSALLLRPLYGPASHPLSRRDRRIMKQGHTFVARRSFAHACVTITPVMTATRRRLQHGGGVVARRFGCRGA